MVENERKKYLQMDFSCKAAASAAIPSLGMQHFFEIHEILMK